MRSDRAATRSWPLRFPSRDTEVSQHWARSPGPKIIVFRFDKYFGPEPLGQERRT